MPATPTDADDDWARFGGDPAERRGGPRRGPEPHEPAPRRGRSAPVDLRDELPPEEYDPELSDEVAAARSRELPTVPVRRLLALAMAGLSFVLTVAMVVGSQLAPAPYAFVVFAVQLAFVVIWTVASQPPAPRIVAVVAILAALGADLVAVSANPASLGPLVYVTAGGFVAGVLGQMIRPAGRVRVTESLGSSLVLVLGVVSIASLVVLKREPLGTQVINAIVIGAGVALVAAHLFDAGLPVPRVAPTVPRGGLGIVVGGMLGTAAAGAAGYFLEGLEPLPTAIAGLAAAVIALMVDLSADYSESSRQLAGIAPALWLVRHMAGPLSAFTLAAPVAYAASTVLARGL
ncbi:hypothetical protein [Virgisporangium aliadipatigenens]|uniref:hypothetical protein n=1 Tax=Virgisporangium aliadipatigenens TaxID=741659 RepID=UPI00194040F4|nr:hypothetical protein [Virgisporangium aliadipatigenens]